MPIFSVPGLPHLTLATRIVALTTLNGQSFRVEFSAMRLAHPDIAYVRDRLEERFASGERILLLNVAADPFIDRILNPGIAPTIAEHPAYTEGQVVLAPDRASREHIPAGGRAVPAVTAQARAAPGRATLSDTDRSYIVYLTLVEEGLFTRALMKPGPLDETLGRAWAVLGLFRRRN